MPTPKISVRVPEKYQEAIARVADERSFPGNEVVPAQVYREAIEQFLKREGHLTIPRNGESTSRSKFHLATD